MEKDLKKAAKEAFEADSSLDSVHVTTDGQAFGQYNAAVLHTKSLPKEFRAITPFTRADQKVDNLSDKLIDEMTKAAKSAQKVDNTKKDPKKKATPEKTAPAVTADMIAKETSIEEIAKLVAGDNRKEIKDAAAARIAELEGNK